MMMTTTMPPAFFNADIDVSRIRSLGKSDGMSLEYPRGEEGMDLLRRTLRSIESVVVTDVDNGACLRRLLCEDNLWARSTGDGRRVWVPIWRYTILEFYITTNKITIIR